MPLNIRNEAVNHLAKKLAAHKRCLIGVGPALRCAANRSTY
jgi:hypothetical protein